MTTPERPVDKAEEIARVDGAQRHDGLTDAMRSMLIESEPDDITGRSGCGVELTTGQLYATAKALERRGLGNREGPGGFLPGMYWSNPDGLAVRAILARKTTEPQS